MRRPQPKSTAALPRKSWFARKSPSVRKSSAARSRKPKSTWRRSPPAAFRRNGPDPRAGARDTRGGASRPLLPLGIRLHRQIQMREGAVHVRRHGRTRRPDIALVELVVTVDAEQRQADADFVLQDLEQPDDARSAGG